MKYSILFFTLLFFEGHFIQAQVYPDRHTTNVQDMWISCEQSTNPNPIRDLSHWILYEFQNVISIHDLQIWNLNHPDYLDDGLNDVIVEVSQDGENWRLIDTFSFPRAAASGIYQGFWGPDLKGAPAKFLLLTALSNHGGRCYGLSEVRVFTIPKKSQDLDFGFTLCEGDGLVRGLTGNLDLHGSYQGSWVNDNNDGTFDFDVESAGVGKHKIEFIANETILMGDLEVLSCESEQCNKCNECQMMEKIYVVGKIIQPEIRGVEVISNGHVEPEHVTRFLVSKGVELNPGFSTATSSIFQVDFRNCYRNILQNSHFEHDLDYWKVYPSAHDGDVKLDTEESEVNGKVVRIEIPDMRRKGLWEIGLFQSVAVFEFGNKYIVGLQGKASAELAPVLLQIRNSDNISQVFSEKYLEFTKDWNSFFHRFEVDKELKGLNVEIGVLLGVEEVEFWLDRFKLLTTE